MENTIIWDGISGKEYKYWIFPIGTTMKALPGNYIFAQEITPGRFRPIYVGETEDLSVRFESHHKMTLILLRGASHVCTHSGSPIAEIRRAEERDIIARWNPIANG